MVQPGPDLVFRVGRRIAALRSERGMTQESLATALGIATKNLQRIESGTQNLTLRSLDVIANALGVEAHELLRSALSTPGDGDRDLASLERAGVCVIPYDPERPQPASTIPVFTLSVAAGPLGRGESPEPLAWAQLPANGSWPRDAFLARVRGRSMEPLVPDGSWCVFAWNRAAAVDEVALIEHRELADADTGASYGLKKIRSVTPRKRGGFIVRLEPVNRRYRTLRIEVDHLEELRVIARLVAVLPPE